VPPPGAVVDTKAAVAAVPAGVAKIAGAVIGAPAPVAMIAKAPVAKKAKVAKESAPVMAMLPRLHLCLSQRQRQPKKNCLVLFILLGW
jgi:hypothetical protein